MMKSFLYLRLLFSFMLLATLSACFSDGDSNDNAASGMNAAFEQLAVLENAGIAGVSMAEKTERVETILDTLATYILNTPDIDVSYGFNDKGTHKSYDALVRFPAVDFDMDGTADDIGRMLEMSIAGDEVFLQKTPKRGIILPWQVAAYTDSANDRIMLIATVPETAVRLFCRDKENFAFMSEPELTERAIQNREIIEQTVADAVTPLGFTVTNQPLAEGPILNERVLEQLQEKFGTLSMSCSTPSVALSDANLSAELVVDAIENTFAAPQLADLNGDGSVSAEDAAVFPTAISEFVGSAMSFEELGGMLAQGPAVWSQGGAFQEWEHLRTLRIPGMETGDAYVIQFCQEYYASMALGFGMYHMPAMPCSIIVWENEEGVNVGILDTRFIFGYWFADVKLAADSPMGQIFTVFPTFVQNEIIGIVNSALTGLGVPAAQQFELQAM